MSSTTRAAVTCRRDSVRSVFRPAPSPLSPAASLRVAHALALIAAVAYTALAWGKYRAFQYTDFDLALFAQAAHGVLHGSFFTSIRGMHWLGDHSSLVLIALAPLTALMPPALALLAAQCAALALGARPVHAYALRRTGDAVLALACALLWLLLPALSWQALFEFHPETIAAPALLAAWVAIDARRPRAALAWTAFALLAKEDVALVALGLAACALLPPRQRQPRLALGLALLAAGSLAISFAWLKPAYGGGADYGMLYRDLGATPREVALHLLRDPLGALARFFTTPGDATDSALKLRFWHQLLIPLAYLPVLAPFALLPAAPVFAEHLLAWRPEQHSIFYQYTALSLPFVMLAAVDGLAQVRAWQPRAATTVAGVAVLLALLAQAQFGALGTLARAGGEPGLGNLAPQATWSDARTRALASERARLLAALPARGDVAASFVFLSHLAARDSVHALHHITGGTFTFSHKPYPLPHDLSGIVCDYSWDDQMAFASTDARARLAWCVGVNALRPVAAAGEMVTYARAARDTVALIRALDAPRDPASVCVDGALWFCGGEPQSLFVAQGRMLEIRLRWQRFAPTDTSYCAELALADADADDALEQPHLVGHAASPPARWRQGQMYEETVRLVVPGDVKPGAYDLRMRFGRIAGAAYVAAADAHGVELPAVVLARIAVTPAR